MHIAHGGYYTATMAFPTVEEAWEAIKWRVHRIVDCANSKKKLEEEAKQRARTKGRVYTAPEDK